MRPVGREDRSIDLNMSFCRNILFITVAVIMAVVERCIFHLVFVVFKIEGLHTVIQSFGDCLQINCLVT